MTHPDKKPYRPSLATLILTGLILGVCLGLFIGEKAAPLAVVGRAYVGLLQMSILPYMVVSLIGGIGNLTYDKAKNLAITAGIVLLASWLLAFLIIFIMPLAFPTTTAGSFYSPSLVQAADVDFIDLYIPSNPFSSLSRTIVPAVAVFSVIAGIALIGVGRKQGLLDVLSAVSDTLTRMAMMVVKLTPIGVFAIAANAAGTMTIDEFGRLQAYILSFIAAVLVLTFWILPTIVSLLTPFSYRDVLRASRSALITGFATGNLFIVLPLLIENGKELFREKELEREDTESYIEVLIPTSFNFPNIGKLLTLLFVLFAGWYTGKELSLVDYPMFATMGLFTLFGGVDLALPFLLDQLRIPSDMYQLYVVTGVVNSWFATLLAVMNLFAFTLIATTAATIGLQFNWRRLIRFAGISTLLLMVVIVPLRIGLGVMIGNESQSRQTLAALEITSTVPAAVYTKIPDYPDTASPGQSRLDQIRERGVMRVGYRSDNLPFAFFNDRQNLVGLDVELAYRLAEGLGVELEFVPWEYEILEEQLDSGTIDIVAGGLLTNFSRLSRLSFSDPYLIVTMGIVVKDHQRNEFLNWAEIKSRKDLKFGIPSPELARDAREYLPRTEIVEIEFYEDFFKGYAADLDGVIVSAEAGSAWTVLYPSYSVAIPEPHQSFPIALAVPRGDSDFERFIDDWLQLEKTLGTIDRLYDKWILGKSPEQTAPRWSIMKDVLHWAD